MRVCDYEVRTMVWRLASIENAREDSVVYGVVCRWKMEI